MYDHDEPGWLLKAADDADSNCQGKTHDPAVFPYSLTRGVALVDYLRFLRDAGHEGRSAEEISYAARHRVKARDWRRHVERLRAAGYVARVKLDVATAEELTGSRPYRPVERFFAVAELVNAPESLRQTLFEDAVADVERVGPSIGAWETVAEALAFLDDAEADAVAEGSAELARALGAIRDPEAAAAEEEQARAERERFGDAIRAELARGPRSIREIAAATGSKARRVRAWLEERESWGFAYRDDGRKWSWLLEPDDGKDVERTIETQNRKAKVVAL